MATPFIGGKFQALNASGIVPGALLYTYAAGTTTPLATFTSQSGLSSNLNPVQCDANGQADVWLGTSAYHMILKTALGIGIWDEDNIPGSTVTSDTGLIDSYAGVDPTGAADSAAAMNTAIAAASAAGVTTLRFPGTYKVLSQVTLAPNMTYAITGTINLNVTEVGLLIPAAATKITIDGGGTITGTCSKAISSVLASTVSDIRIRNLSISGATLAGLSYTNGIFLDGASRVWIENNRMSGNGIGSSTATGNGDITIYANTNATVFVRGNVCSSTTAGFGIAVYNATEVHIDNNTVSGMVSGSSQNNGYGILNYSSVALASKRSTISNNIVMNTGGSGIYCADVTGATVSGNTIFNVAQTQTDVSLPVGGISLNGCVNAEVVGNSINTSGKAGIVASNCVRTSIIGGTVTNCLNGGVYLRGTGDGTVVQGVQTENNTVNIVADATAKSGLLIDVVSRLSKATTRGIDLANVSGSVIRGVSSNNARNGLAIAAGANNVIDGLICLDNGTDAANTYSGIGVSSTNTKVINCRSGNTAATGQQYGIVSTGNYCTIQNNDATRNQTDGTNLTGTALQISGNRVSTSATPGASQGSGVLVAGTVTITTDEVRAGDLILLTCVTAGGTQGIARVSTITNATSFVITSSQAGDTSTYQYQIVH